MVVAANETKFGIDFFSAAVTHPPLSLGAAKKICALSLQASCGVLFSKKECHRVWVNR